MVGKEERLKRVGWGYGNKAILLYKPSGYHSQYSLCKECLLGLCTSVVLGIFSQDQNTMTNIKLFVCIYLKCYNTKDIVTKSKHAWHEWIIREIAACILVIWHSCLSWICTCLCDVMRQTLPAKILAFPQMPQMPTLPDPSNNMQKSFGREMFLKYHHHKKINSS